MHYKLIHQQKITDVEEEFVAVPNGEQYKRHAIDKTIPLSTKRIDEPLAEKKSNTRKQFYVQFMQTTNITY